MSTKRINNSQSKSLLNCLNTTTDTALKSVTSSIIIFEKKIKNHISCAECSNQQYSKLLACGCIIGAELSHWHGSNLCLHALKSAVTGWNNNYVLISHWSFQWITARGDSSVSQDKPTARVESDMRRIASIDGQCRNVSLNKNVKLHKLWSENTKCGTNLPVHNQEHCTQKAGRPPSLQRACNVAVGEEQRRTLLWLRLNLWTGKS